MAHPCAHPDFLLLESAAFVINLERATVSLVLPCMRHNISAALAISKWRALIQSRGYAMRNPVVTIHTAYGTCVIMRLAVSQTSVDTGKEGVIVSPKGPDGA